MSGKRQPKLANNEHLWGYRAGYHPRPAVIPTLKPYEKSAKGSVRNYIDANGQVYSKRAVQEARQGYLSIELARDVRKAGHAEVLRRAKESGTAVITMARRYAHVHDLPSVSVTLKSSRFWKSLDNLNEYLSARSRVFGPAESGSVVESQLRMEIDQLELLDDLEDYDLPDDTDWDDIYDFFDEWNDDWVMDLYDDFGFEAEDELGHYH